MWVMLVAAAMLAWAPAASRAESQDQEQVQRDAEDLATAASRRFDELMPTLGGGAREDVAARPVAAEMPKTDGTPEIVGQAWSATRQWLADAQRRYGRDVVPGLWLGTPPIRGANAPPPTAAGWEDAIRRWLATASQAYQRDVAGPLGRRGRDPGLDLPEPVPSVPPSVPPALAAAPLPPPPAVPSAAAAAPRLATPAPTPSESIVVPAPPFALLPQPAFAAVAPPSTRPLDDRTRSALGVPAATPPAAQPTRLAAKAEAAPRAASVKTVRRTRAAAVKPAAAKRRVYRWCRPPAHAARWQVAARR